MTASSRSSRIIGLYLGHGCSISKLCVVRAHSSPHLAALLVSELFRRLLQRSICIPSSTTRSGGMPKYCVAERELREMNEKRALRQVCMPLFLVASTSLGRGSSSSTRLVGDALVRGGPLHDVGRWGSP